MPVARTWTRHSCGLSSGMSVSTTLSWWSGVVSMAVLFGLRVNISVADDIVKYQGES